jgi:AcrR family transcriptional regulator
MPKNGRSQSLTHKEIIEAAVRLIRKHGLPNLTMRAVAAELGVTPMAVYHYFADKDDLVRMVVQSISSAREPLRIREGGWEESLRSHLREVWEQSARYPGVGAYQIDQPSLGVTPEALQDGIRFFEDAGFSPSAARLAWSFAMTYIHGRISVDAHLASKPDAPRLDGLRAHDYVDFGVETVVAGLRAALASELDASGNREGVGGKSVVTNS